MGTMTATRCNPEMTGCPLRVKSFLIDLKKMENICPERSEEILLGYNPSSNSCYEKDDNYYSFFVQK